VVLLHIVEHTNVHCTTLLGSVGSQGTLGLHTPPELLLDEDDEELLLDEDDDELLDEDDDELLDEDDDELLDEDDEEVLLLDEADEELLDELLELPPQSHGLKPLPSSLQLCAPGVPPGQAHAICWPGTQFIAPVLEALLDELLELDELLVPPTPPVLPVLDPPPPEPPLPEVAKSTSGALQAAANATAHRPMSSARASFIECILAQRIPALAHPSTRSPRSSMVTCSGAFTVRRRAACPAAPANTRLHRPRTSARSCHWRRAWCNCRRPSKSSPPSSEAEERAVSGVEPRQ
jgi:hypothetical protein